MRLTLLVLLISLVSCSNTQRGPASLEKFSSEVNSVRSNQEAKENQYLMNYVSMLKKDYPLEASERTMKYIGPFLYRPIWVRSEKELTTANEFYVFNSILDENYVPLFVDFKNYTKEIIDPIPSNKLKVMKKNLLRWTNRFFDKRRFVNNKVVIVRDKKPATNGMILVYGFDVNTFDEGAIEEMLAKYHSLYPSEKIVLVLSEKFTHQNSADNMKRLFKYGVDAIYQEGDQVDFKVVAHDANKMSEAIQDLSKQISQYFESVPDLPRNLYFRGPNENFSFRYYLVLREGELWIKSNEDFTGRTEAWMKLSQEFLPEKYSGIKSISADGVAFVLRDHDDVLYRSGEFFLAPNHWKWFRNMGWLGLPLLSKADLKIKDGVMWDVTDSSQRVNLWEEDLLGNRHPFLPGPDGQPGGIAQIYVLGEDEHTIYSNDYWVSADWRRVVCGPEKNQLKVETLSSSASTLFLLGKNGKMYTRFWNYNIDGAGAPTNRYTLDPKKAKAGKPITTRFLPTEGWYEQPLIKDGVFTNRITIVQTGHAGNAARELRVEGKLDGQTGYYKKYLFEDEWRFVVTGEKLQSELFEKDNDPLVASDSKVLEGTLNIGSSYSAKIVNFSLYCSPSYLSLKVGKSEVVLVIHTGLKSPISSKKDDYYRKEGELNVYNAYIELPEKYLTSKDSEVKKFIEELNSTWKNHEGRFYYGTIHANEESVKLETKAPWLGLKKIVKGVQSLLPGSKVDYVLELK